MAIAGLPEIVPRERPRRLLLPLAADCEGTQLAGGGVCQSSLRQHGAEVAAADNVRMKMRDLLMTVAAELARRDGMSGIEEKRSRANL